MWRTISHRSGQVSEILTIDYCNGFFTKHHARTSFLSDAITSFWIQSYWASWVGKKDLTETINRADSFTFREWLLAQLLNFRGMS